jgi:DNA-binding beta-propeller fold protein YncE
MVGLLSGGIFYRTFEAEFVAALPSMSLNGDVNDEVNEDTDVIFSFDSSPGASTAGFQWLVDRDDGNGEVPFMANNLPMNTGTTQIDVSGNDQDADIEGGDAIFVEYTLNGDFPSGSGNQARYDVIDGVADLPFLLPATSCLEYNVAWKEGSEFIGIDLFFTDNTDLRDRNLPDQNGRSTHPAENLNVYATDGNTGYFSRQINLSSIAGLSVSAYALGAEFDTPGLTKDAFFSNIRITDCSGNTLHTGYSSGPVSLTNVLSYGGGDAVTVRAGLPTLETSDCQVGVCYDFKGAPSTIAPAAETDVKNSFTIEFWAKPTATRESSTEQNANFTISGVNGQRYAVFPPQKGAVDAGVGVSVGTNGVSVFEHGNDHLPSILVYDTPINDWTHVVVTYDLHRPKLYLNGTLVRTGIKSFRSDIYPGTQLGGQATNVLGRGDTYGPYLGLLDEFRLYPTVLTPQQIDQNYMDGVAGEGGPTRILTQEHSVDDLWTLNTFEVFSNGTLIDSAIPVDTVLIVTGTSETVMTIEDPIGPQTEWVYIKFYCLNTQDLKRDVIVEFSEDSGNSWHPATLTEGPIAAGGVSENRILNVLCDNGSRDIDTFAWDSQLDGVGAQGAPNPNVQVRVTADTSPVGASILTATTGDFSVQNEAAPEAIASTFLGGNSVDEAYGIGFDMSGNVVMIGKSTDSFPTTSGAYQETDPSILFLPNDSIVISKFSEDLTTLLVSTYIGGDAEEETRHGKVDENGNVYISGITYSENLPSPLVPNGFDTVRDVSGFGDIFLIKMNQDLDTVLYSTYIGGEDYDDQSGGIAVHPTNGKVFLTGYTMSIDLPITAGAFDTIPDGSTGNYNGDGMVAFIDTNESGATSLQYMSYLGGEDNYEWLYYPSMDASGNGYAIGETYSNDFPAITSGSFDDVINGSNGDGFLVKIDPDGNSSTSLVYGTAIGGSDNYDAPFSSFVRGSDVYVCGLTQSSDFVTTPGAYTESGGGENGGFIYLLNLDGNGSDDLIAGTLLGTSGSEWCNDMLVESNGDVVIVGLGDETYPTTFDAFDRTFNGNAPRNSVISKLSSNFDELLYSTYFEGTTDQSGNNSLITGVAKHSNGDIYFTGHTDISNFPVFNGHDSTFGGGKDIFVSRFNLPEQVVNATDESFITVLRNEDEDFNVIGAQINSDTQSSVVTIDKTDDSRTLVNGTSDATLLGFTRDFSEASGTFAVHADGGTGYARNIYVSRFDNVNNELWSTQLLNEGGTYSANGFVDVVDDGSGGVYVLLYEGDVFSGDNFYPVLFYVDTTGAIDSDYPITFDYSYPVGRMVGDGQGGVIVVTRLGGNPEEDSSIYTGYADVYDSGGFSTWNGGAQFIEVTTNTFDKKYELEILSVAEELLVFWWEQQGAMYVLRSQFIHSNGSIDEDFGEEGIIIAREPQPSTIQANHIVTGEGEGKVFVSYYAHVPNGTSKLKTTEFSIWEGSKTWPCIQRVDYDGNGYDIFRRPDAAFGVIGPSLGWVDSALGGNGLYVQMYDEITGDSWFQPGGEIAASDVQHGGDYFNVTFGTPSLTGVGYELDGLEAFYTYQVNTLSGVENTYDSVTVTAESFDFEDNRGDCAAGFTSDEILVNTYTADAQGQVAVDHDENGNYVVIWESFGQSDEQDVFGQRFDSFDLPIGLEFQVNSSTSVDQVSNRNSLAVNDDGSFVVTWSDNNFLDGDEIGVFMQLFDVDGNFVNGETQVNDFTTGDQTLPSVASDASGNFVIVWQSVGQDGFSNGIYGKRFDASGNALTPPGTALKGTEVGEEFRVNTTTTESQTLANVAMDPNGNFVVVWRGGLRNYFQLYNAAGEPVGGETEIFSAPLPSSSNLSVDMDDNGNFVVVWDDLPEAEIVGTIMAQIFDASGNPVGDSFQVDQDDEYGKFDPNVTMDPDGNFVVTWTSIDQDGDSDGVFYRKYSADGTPTGNEAQISQNSSGEQDTTAGTMINDNYFILAWEDSSDSLDLDNEAVYIRSFRNEVGEASAPAQIGEFYVYSGNETAPMYWIEPSDNGSPITDYIIQYGETAGYPGNAVEFNDGVGTDLESIVDGLVNDTEYTFQVAAVNAIGTGPFSDEVTAIPQAPLVYPEFSTFIGGGEDDGAKGIGLDTSGNIVIIGETLSSDFPLEDEIQGALSGSVDGFITVLSPDGTTVLLSTYIGGSEDDSVRAGRVDSSGNIYMAGYSDSDDLFTGPRTPTLSGFDMTLDDEYQDVFLMKFNEDLSEIMYGTFWGGTGSDLMDGKTMRADNAGNVYLAGVTFEFGPLTANAFDNVPDPNGDHEVFVSKIDTTVSGLSSLEYASYVGGGAFENVWGINFDSSGNIYVAGETYSSDFPGITSGALRETVSEENADGFVIKIDPTEVVAADTLVYGTIVGGDSDYDGAYDVAPASNGDIFVCGQFWSDDSLTTDGAYNQENSGAGDSFIYHLSPDGAGEDDLLYGSYLGGEGDDWCNEIHLDSNGTIAFSGTAYEDFPTTDDAFQADQFRESDVIIGRFIPAGNGEDDLIYASYFGGGLEDFDQGAFYDDANDIYYLSGDTSSQNIPISVGTFQVTNNGGWDGFAMSMELPNVSAPDAIEDLNALSGDEEVVLIWSQPGTNGSVITDYIVEYGITSGFPGNVQVFSDGVSDETGATVTGLTNGTEYTFRVAAVNGEGTGPYSNEENETPNAPVPYTGFSTYLGGTEGGEQGMGIGLNPSGNIVIIGDTTSTDFPLVNEFQATTIPRELFVTILSADGSTALLSTYIGTDGDNYANIGRVDSSGNIYIAGVNFEFSENPPTLAGFLPSMEDGVVDVYLLKMNAAVDEILYGTYIAGTGEDWMDNNALRVDDSGVVYIGGYTYSTDFPVTANAFDSTGDEESGDAFVAKIDTTVSGSNSLLYSTYLGGANFDRTWDVSFDTAGNIYVSGETESADFAAITSGAFKESIGSESDAFLVKIDPDAVVAQDSLAYGTFIGGDSWDGAGGVAVNAADEVFVCGWFESSDAYTTPGAYSSTNSGAEGDMFIYKMSLDGAGVDDVLYGSYVGGTGDDYCSELHLDTNGTVVFSGGSTGAFPTTDGAFQEDSAGGLDALLGRFDPSGNGSDDLVFASYFGGSEDDYDGAAYYDEANQLYYLAGTTHSLNFPINPADYLTAHTAPDHGESNAFAMSMEMPNAETGVPVIGTCKQADNSTNCADGQTVRVAVNGVLDPNTTTTSGGTWTISDVTVLSGEVVTVFKNGVGEANEAVTVTRYDGTGDLTGIQLIEEHLTIGSDDNATISNVDLALYDNSVSADEDIFFEVDASNDLTVDFEGGHDDTLLILSGNTFRPDSTSSGNVTMNEIEIEGSFVLDGNTIFVAGNWANTGSLNVGTSTLNFTSSSTQTLSSGSAPFATVTHSGSGTLQLLDELTVTTAFNNDAGTLDLNGQTWTMTGATFSNDATVQLQGSETVTGLTQDTDSGTWEYVGDGAAGTETFSLRDFGSTDYFNLTLTGDATETLQQTAATVVANTLTVTSGTYAQNGFDTAVNGANTLIIDGGTYEQGNNPLTVTGNLQVLNSGIFNGSNTGAAIDVNGDVDLQVTADTARLTSGTMTVAGDWTNAMATGFDHNEGTVQFDTSAAAAINGSTVWYNVTIDEPATGKTLTFEAGEVQTFETGGTLSATGDVGNLITFVSSDPGVTQWEITHEDENSGNMSYVSVTDGACTASSDLYLTDSTDGGNNDACWIFAEVDNTDPVVILVQPNGGEDLIGGSSYDIIWNATDNSGIVDTIDLEFTSNDADYAPISGATGLTNGLAYSFELTWGTSGTGNGEFNNPSGIAVDALGNVYVADDGNNRIQKFDSTGTYITQWGSSGNGNGEFNDPRSLAVDDSGNVYVVDTDNNRIQKFDSDGTYLTQWGTVGTGNGQFDNPYNIALSASGNVYVVDTFNFRIQKFDSNGTYLTQWGTNGSGNGQFDQLRGIAVDASGNVYTTEYGNHRVQKFDTDGIYLTQWGTNGSGNGQFDYPYGIAVDASGNVYVVDQANYRIQKFDSDGTYLTQWGTNGFGDGQFNNPISVVADGSGNVYVGGDDRIQKFSPGGFFTWTVPLTSTSLARIRVTATDPDANSAQDLSNAVFTISSVSVPDAVDDLDATAGDEEVVLAWSAPFDGGSAIADYIVEYGITSGFPGNTQVFSEGTSAVTGSIVTGLTNGIEYSFRVKAVNGEGESDYSNVITAIPEADAIDPVVILVQPNGGEDLIGGSSYDIIWNATDNTGIVDTIDLEFTSNDADYAPILGATGLTNDAIFELSWGTSGTGNGEFEFPYDIAVDASSNVYVVDSYNHRVQKFDSDGNYLTQWGTNGSGNGQFESPDGVAVDDSGNVYVVDAGNHRIQKFTNTGTYLTQWGTNGSGNSQFDSPAGIAVDASGNVYVVDTYNYRIQKFTDTGTYLTQWGTNGSGNGQFDSPSGVAVDASGNVYTTESGNHRVQKFDSTGTYLTQWGTNGSGDGQFEYPNGIAVDASGNVYVVDEQTYRVQKFDNSGSFLTKWGSFGTGNGQFDALFGIAVDGSGNVYVADSINYRIQKFFSGGSFSWTVPLTSTSLARIRVTATDLAANSALDLSNAVFTISTVSVPEAVDDLDATAGDEEVILTWSAPANGGSAITDYIVEYGETVGFPGNAQVFSEATSATTGATVTGLTNGTGYSFRVATVNAIGTGAYSNVDTATPFVAAVPDAIVNLVATGANGQVTLTWTAPANNGSAITDYIVEYGETVGFPGNAQVFADGTSSLTGATVTGLVNATEYSFRVAAVNGVGQGPYSNVDTATPAAGSAPVNTTDAQITVDINDFLSFSIENLAAGDEAAGDQPFGAGAEITDLTSTGNNDYAISGDFGSPVYTRLQTSTNSTDGYNVIAYAANLDGRTNTLLRSGGTPASAADEIADSLNRLPASQAPNVALVLASATGLAFRLLDANTDVSLRGADEDTQWGDGDAGTALWASFPLGSGEAQVIYDTLNFSDTPTTAYLNWFVGISPQQRSGSYSGQVTFTASVN